MNVYFQVRSSQLDRSIKGLKEHFRKNSATTAIHSPAVQAKRKETPTKKAPKRPGQWPLTPDLTTSLGSSRSDDITPQLIPPSPSVFSY